MSFSIFFPCGGCGACVVFNLGEFDGEMSNSLVVDIYLRDCVCDGVNVGEYLGL